MIPVAARAGATAEPRRGWCVGEERGRITAMKNPTDRAATADAGADLETSIPGSLLIAVPRLADPHFARMVVLMLHHDRSGAFGLVLGPQSELTLAKVAGDLGVRWARTDQPPLRYGGPCEPGRIFLLHSGEGPLPASQEIKPGLGLYFGATTELIEQLSEEPERKVVAIAGYAGWGPGQLEREVTEQSWLFGDPTLALVFETDPDGLYEAALQPLAATESRVAQLIGAIASGRGASA